MAATASPLALAPTPAALLTVGAVAIIALVLAQYVAAPRPPKGTRALPGPKGLPWIGSLRDMPAVQVRGLGPLDWTDVRTALETV